MPKLFPSVPRRTYIEQVKSVGSCYLLVVLDSLLNNAHPQGANYLKSLFTETETEIIVRIKHNPLSYNLTRRNTERYHYRLDRKRGEDVFVIDKDKWCEIENDPLAVKTNAFAVKILERICSYYFSNDWQAVESSLTAHAFRETDGADKVQLSSIEFISQWLTIDVKNIPDLKQVSLVRDLFPTLGIYLSMKNGETRRHAYGLGSMHRMFDNQHDRQCELINPFNNKIVESHALSKIGEQAPVFYLIDTHTEEYRLACILLGDPDLFFKLHTALAAREACFASPPTGKLQVDMARTEDHLNQILNELRAKHRLSIEETQLLSRRLSKDENRVQTVKVQFDTSSAQDLIVVPAFKPKAAKLSVFADVSKENQLGRGESALTVTSSSSTTDSSFSSLSNADASRPPLSVPDLFVVPAFKPKVSRLSVFESVSSLPSSKEPQGNQGLGCHKKS